MERSSTEQSTSTRNPRTVKAALVMSLASAIGWIAMYVAVLTVMSFEGDGALAHPFVHPAAAGYLVSGLIGSWFMRQKTRVNLGGAIVLWGYITTTVTLVILAFPLFIPWQGFPWYVYPMLALFFAGVLGGSLVIR
jgi:hypothetical protein